MARPGLTEADLTEAALALEPHGPAAALRWAFERFKLDEIALACSFGVEDVLLVDLMAKVRPGSRVFYLDTHLLFPETYGLIERIKAAYDVQIERYEPTLTLTEQAKLHGDGLWQSNPDECCAIRKVEPLQRALAGLKAWITGIRREQAPTRENTPVVEWDAKFGLVKINPLAAWSEKDVWSYIMANNVDYNPLHDHGYPSIGCIHCTRAVKPGEDPRAGRWSGTDKTECGLHPVRRDCP